MYKEVIILTFAFLKAWQSPNPSQIIDHNFIRIYFCLYTILNIYYSFFAKLFWE